MLLADLNAQIEKWFHCMVGPPMAYFELPVPNSLEHVRYVYQTMGFQMACRAKVQEDLNTAQEALLRRVHQEFETAWKSFGFPLAEDDNRIITPPCLFWRRKLAFQMERGFARLHCRVVIPGYEFPATARPEEGSYNWPRVSVPGDTP